MPTRTQVTASWAAEGCLVTPLISQFFQDPDFHFEFSLHLVRPLRRAPDGWFHASTHPTMSHRDLYTYLTAPQDLPQDPMGYIGWMSTMFGTVTHGVIAAALERFGIVVPLPEGRCVACGLPHPKKGQRQQKGYCFEHGAVHEETRSRCHLDSILDFGGLGTFGYELKTIKPYSLSKVPNMDAEFYRTWKPKYWAQNQECMRITGLRKFIVFFINLGNPWEMREFHVPFDPAFAAETEAKYRVVLDHAARGVPVLL